ncbi:cystathionine beta-lyase [Thermosipho melanesiensis]|uniref:cysteine-S-conjugate beta-lyase n=2 Tax=Thermosipho melanesiensis TaxID=46541 RepID=A6LMF7_THEM4|nr:MalY/PatB family protein [Thermosipho melanesiensis]ABR31108.1 aminotransferase, class I and II [Thermosipho melanesiensis BI429]APT74199.1 cystathionine beta-lyase [Thermosipho melanesiensis]OOC36146.1 cystathionine beta-lyase [Thermosipho melanesiensis]OOC36963.1 cystathionine beta-lyase [Thermosipho melanesiensis]OOC37715.1 cystathionine beta-lyase [Thermosipho melanesiensis]
MFNNVPNRKGTNSFKWDLKPNVLPLWVADMDFEVSEEIKEAIKSRVNHGVYGYTFRPKSYYEAIINWFRNYHAFDIKREWIVPIPGVVPGISFAIQAFTLPGDKIIIQPPVYRPFHEVVVELGRRLIYNKLIESDGYYKMDFEDLENKIDKDVKMLILCSPHNPVGRVWKEEELKRLGEICLRNNIIVVSDEIHADIVYKRKHNVFLGVNEKFFKNSIVLTSPNKSFNIAGLQSGNAIIPNKCLRERFEKIINSQHLGLSNIFAIVATEVAYNYGRQWLEKLLDYLYQNVLLVKEFLEKELNIKVSVPEGTFLMWLDFRKFDDAYNRVLNAGVWLNDGKDFGPGGEGFLRMNIATSREILNEALKRIKSITF